MRGQISDQTIFSKKLVTYTAEESEGLRDAKAAAKLHDVRAIQQKPIWFSIHITNTNSHASVRFSEVSSKTMEESLYQMHDVIRLWRHAYVNTIKEIILRTHP